MIPYFLHSTPALLNFSGCHHCDNMSTELRLRSPTSQSQVPLLCYVTQQINIPCDFSFLLCVKRWLGYSSTHSVLQTVSQQVLGAPSSSLPSDSTIFCSLWLLGGCFSVAMCWISQIGDFCSQKKPEPPQAAQTVHASEFLSRSGLLSWH